MALGPYKCNAEAVVVILASGPNGLNFPQANAWELWLGSSTSVGFVLYVENEKLVPTFWRPFVCPVTRSSAWGEFSLVTAELDALAWGERMYKKARWFYVVSGDSIPTKNCKTYVRGPDCKVSVLGFPRVPARINYEVTLPMGCSHLYEHAQWKILSKSHVKLLCKKLLPNVHMVWGPVHRELKYKMCCAIAPDEWLIGTFLREEDEKANVDWALGTCMMELDFEDELRSCCGEFTGHAIKVEWGDPMIAIAIADSTTFAVRKVSQLVEPSELLKALDV